MTDLDRLRVVFLLANEGVEQEELEEPWDALRDAGVRLDLVAPHPGTVQAFHHRDRGDTFPVTTVLGDANVDDYDALVLPGGVANPDALRLDPRAVQFVRDFMDTRRTVAAICHAPWMLVEADVVRGRTLTSWPSLQTDIRNAGGTWIDHELVMDDNLLTSRRPADLPVFTAALLEVLRSVPSVS
jgi:protease I